MANFKQRIMNKIQRPVTLPRAIICDIDGTLAITGDRSPFDWKKVGLDTLNYPVAKLVEIMNRYGHKIILCSGRDESCRDETIKWLKYYQIKYDHLFMRPEKDNRKDSIIKEEIYNKHIKDKFYIEFVLDDRDQVVDLWRKKLGLPCFQVNYGNF